MKNKLMPLRIPPQWGILFNTFVDENPCVDEDGDIDNWLSYKEGVLIIKQLIPVPGGWSTEQRGLLLDLSWNPDGKWPGEYHISLIKRDWDTIVLNIGCRIGIRLSRLSKSYCSLHTIIVKKKNS